MVECPICNVDITEDLDAETLAEEFDDVQTEPLVKRGECPHCARPIKVYLRVDMVEKDEDANGR